jgi:hypothetical protein
MFNALFAVQRAPASEGMIVGRILPIFTYNIVSSLQKFYPHQYRGELHDVEDWNPILQIVHEYLDRLGYVSAILQPYIPFQERSIGDGMALTMVHTWWCSDQERARWAALQDIADSLSSKEGSARLLAADLQLLTQRSDGSNMLHDHSKLLCEIVLLNIPQVIPFGKAESDYWTR